MPRLMGEDLGSSRRASGPFLYHVDGEGILEPSETGHSVPPGPSELREGPKWQHADEDQPGSGVLASKRDCSAASR